VAAQACGECWEITTSTGDTAIYMVDNLCGGPNACSNTERPHFDLTSTSADAVFGDVRAGTTVARPIPCPITGNIHFVGLGAASGLWKVIDDVFRPDDIGARFRFVSPTGEIALGDVVLTDDVAETTLFDTGAQFEEASVEGHASPRGERSRALAEIRIGHIL
jgi:hypothetical protein